MDWVSAALEDPLLVSRVSNIIIPAILHAAFDLMLFSINEDNIKNIYDRVVKGNYLLAYSDPSYIWNRDPPLHTNDPLFSRSSADPPANMLEIFDEGAKQGAWSIFPSSRNVKLHYPTRFIVEMKEPDDRARVYELVASLARLIKDENGLRIAELYKVESLLREENESLRKSLSEYESRENSIEDDGPDLIPDQSDTLYARISSLEREISDRTNSENALKSANERLEHEVARLKTESENMSPLSDVASLVAKLSTCEDEKKTLRTVLNEEKALVAQREKEIKDWKLELEHCQARGQQYQSDLVELERKCRLIEEKSVSRKRKLEEKNAELTEMKANMLEEKRYYDESIAEARANYKEASERRNFLEVQNERLLSDLKTTNAKLDEKTRDYQRIFDGLVECQRKVTIETSEFKEEIESLKKENTILRSPSTSSTSKSFYDEVVELLEQKTAQYEKLKNRIESLGFDTEDTQDVSENTESVKPEGIPEDKESANKRFQELYGDFEL